MDKLCLEDQLCFRLYALSRKVTSVYRPVLDALDITYPQYLVLLVLWEHQSVSVKELGERLYLDSGTLTPLLKRMEQKKLVSRNRDKADERSVIVSLATAGEALREKAAIVPERLISCMPMEYKEYKQLREQLDGLIAIIKE